MKSPSNKEHRIWTVPTIIGVVTLIGLLGALVGDAYWDWFASLLLFGVQFYASALGLKTSDR